MFSTTTLVKIALILDAEEEENNIVNKAKKRRYWVHPMIKKRKTEGEYYTLFKELMDDESKFYIYYRMSIGEFHNLLSHIKDAISKPNSQFRESITPIEKLSVCLSTAEERILDAYKHRRGCNASL
ncbi:hypothetical protein RI129_000814 [Pyrocoelia pectoralis]|uniref:Protein ALP1-like n=1 Tax=Pyrocoelia pectoralis TaxID=417401 RepID=A0AAN7VL88_9COLE